MRTLVATLLTGVLMACASADAQQQNTAQAAPAASPCAAPEFRQMDFWVGEWDARWEASPGQPAGVGTNTITREYDNCVIQEQFDGGPSTGNLIGHSVSTYHAPTQRWRQTWVDNQGGYFALVGGPQGNDFVLIMNSYPANVPVRRMLFTDITPNAFTWRWQASTDGGATWTDSWVIHYTRRGS